MLDEKGCLALEDALVLSIVTIMAASAGCRLASQVGRSGSLPCFFLLHLSQKYKAP